MSWINRDLASGEAPVQPMTAKRKVLVTGATAYIGGRLVPRLLAKGYDVRVMVRVFSSEYQDRWPNAEIIGADALNYPGLARMFLQYSILCLRERRKVGEEEFLRYLRRN